MGEIVVETNARRLCKVCGEPVVGDGKTAFCSDACRRIWRKRPHWRNCNLCGVLFFAEEGVRQCPDCRSPHSPAPGKLAKLTPGTPFEGFLRAQRKARAAGRELKYADWQRGRYEK